MLAPSGNATILSGQFVCRVWDSQEFFTAFGFNVKNMLALKMAF